MTSDRRTEGLLTDAAIYENIALPQLARFSNWLGVVREREMIAAGWRNMARLNVKAPSPLTRAGLLSGGNQQKVVFAKWLEANPRILILYEPTLGVDVGSKGEIRAIIEGLSRDGLGVILLTTELSDIEQLCDRVLVMFRGQLVAELAGAEVQSDAILRASTSGRVVN